MFDIADNQPKVRQTSMRSICAIQPYLGVIVEQTPAQDQVLEKIWNALEKGGMVIALTNDFYNPLRLDMFHKQHKPHNILIYDMDKTKRRLQIVESKYRNAVLYEPLYIEFEDFLETQAHTVEKEMTIVYVDTSTTTKEPMADFLGKAFDEMEPAMIISAGRLEVCGELLKEQQGEIGREGWTAFFNDACNQYQTCAAVYKEIFHHETLAKLADDIYRKWYSLRISFVKDVRTGSFRAQCPAYCKAFSELAEKERIRIKIMRTLIGRISN